MLYAKHATLKSECRMQSACACAHAEPSEFTNITMHTHTFAKERAVCANSAVESQIRNIIFGPATDARAFTLTVGYSRCRLRKVSFRLCLLSQFSKVGYHSCEHKVDDMLALSSK